MQKVAGLTPPLAAACPVGASLLHCNSNAPLPILHVPTLPLPPSPAPPPLTCPPQPYPTCCVPRRPPIPPSPPPPHMLKSCMTSLKSEVRNWS